MYDNVCFNKNELKWEETNEKNDCMILISSVKRLAEMNDESSTSEIHDIESARMPKSNQLAHPPSLQNCC